MRRSPFAPHRHGASLLRRAAAVTGLAAVAVLPTVASAGANPSGSTLVGPQTAVTEIGSTVPANGDVNPYGVAVVLHSQGTETAGDVLVSKFNSGPGPSGSQGEGTTIVELNPADGPNATPQLFAQIDPDSLPGACPGGIGLTTALDILPGGWVVVGSLPTSDGTEISGAGCLLVLSDTGRVVETLAGGLINGPWDMAAASFGDVSELFFTNVLNGTVNGAGNVVDQGTVVRAVLVDRRAGPPQVAGLSVIASGYPEELNGAALVIGPTGLALGGDGTLYVADTIDNRIDAVPDALVRRGPAGPGFALSTGGALNGPLGLATTADGNLLAVNGGDGNLVELSPSGRQLGAKTISPGGGGALFGLALSPNGRALYFVDDSENQLNVL